MKKRRHLEVKLSVALRHLIEGGAALRPLNKTLRRSALMTFLMTSRSRSSESFWSLTVNLSMPSLGWILFTSLIRDISTATTRLRSCTVSTLDVTKFPSHLELSILRSFSLLFSYAGSGIS